MVIPILDKIIMTGFLEALVKALSRTVIFQKIRCTCFNETHAKIMKNSFYFTLKARGHVEKPACLER